MYDMAVYSGDIEWLPKGTQAQQVRVWGALGSFGLVWVVVVWILVVLSCFGFILLLLLPIRINVYKRDKNTEHNTSRV